MVLIVLEIWKYGPEIEDMKIILQGNNNDIRSYVTSTHYVKSLMTQLTSNNKEKDSPDLLLQIPFLYQHMVEYLHKHKIVNR